MIKIKLFFSVFSLRQYLYDAKKDPRANVKVEFVPKENENKCSDTNTVGPRFSGIVGHPTLLH